MICRNKRLIRWIVNGTLFSIVSFILILCLLNLINQKLPSLRCFGSDIVEPDISHKYKGDTVSVPILVFVCLVIPYVQIVIIEYLGNRILRRRHTSIKSFIASSLPSASPYRGEGGNDPSNPSPASNPREVVIPTQTTQNQNSRWKTILFMYSTKWYADYLFGLIFMLLINDIAKITLNAPRPHFIDTCKPTFSKEACQLGWLDDYKCTNEDVTRFKMVDSHKSFPSGHAAMGMYSALYMILYQHQKLSFKKLGTIVILCLHTIWFLWGIFCGLSRVMDHRHHPIDIIIGGIIGTLGALFSVFVLSYNFKARINIDESSGRNSSSKYLPPQHRRYSDGTTLNEFESNQHHSINSTSLTSNGDVKRQSSLRRLLSQQSTMTQMSDISEDGEIYQV